MGRFPFVLSSPCLATSFWLTGDAVSDLDMQLYGGEVPISLVAGGERQGWQADCDFTFPGVTFRVEWAPKA